jgi:RNA polymerase sigma factor (sigma-70 family)
MANTNGSGRHDRNVALKADLDEVGCLLAEAREAGDSRLTERLERKLERLKDEFATANWGLAVSVAKTYFPRGDSSHSNADDYVGAALLGLWEAFLGWNPSKGSFSHWSRLHIEGATKRTVRAFEAPEVSYGDFTARPSVRAAQVRLRDELGRTPTEAEIAEECGETVDLVRRALAPRPLSLDMTVGEDDTTFGDTIIAGGLETEFSESSEDAVFGDSEGEIGELVASAELSPTELWVVVRHYGLDGGEPESLVRIGDTIDKGRQTVQRHSAKAQATLTSKVS